MPKEKPFPKVDLCECESSRIHAHGYCQKTNTLALQFKAKGGDPGSIYHYDGFEPAAYEDLKNAESIGKFFGARVNVRNEDGSLRYPFRKLPAIPA